MFHSSKESELGIKIVDLDRLETIGFKQHGNWQLSYFDGSQSRCSREPFVKHCKKHTVLEEDTSHNTINLIVENRMVAGTQKIGGSNVPSSFNYFIK